MAYYYSTYDITTDFGLIDSFSLSFDEQVEDIDTADISEDSGIQILKYDVEEEGGYDIDVYYSLLLGDISADPIPVEEDIVQTDNDVEFTVSYTSGEGSALSDAYETNEWPEAVDAAMQDMVKYVLSSSIKLGNLMNFKKVKSPGVPRSSVSIFGGSDVASSGISITTTTTITSDDGAY